MKKILFVLAPVVSTLIAFGCAQPGPGAPAAQGPPGGPKFAVDPYWPKQLKENRIFAQVAGLAIDTRDHVWVLHRPGTVLADEKAKVDPTVRCCTILPAVTEFDTTTCRAGAAPDRATTGRRTSTASMSIPRATCGSRGTTRPTT